VILVQKVHSFAGAGPGVRAKSLVLNHGLIHVIDRVLPPARI
jgi:hypothetical protein